MSDKEIMKEMRRRQLMEGINRSSEAMVSMQEQTRRAEATAAMEEQALHASQGLASQQLQFVQGMATEADLRENAGAATLKESAGERKKRREREQTRQKALRQGRRVRDLEGGLLPQRVDVFDSQQLTGEQARQEKLLLKEKLKEILLEREAKLKEAESNGPLDEAARRKLDWETQAEQAKAAGEYARILTPGSKERREAMDVKERMELKADNLKRLYKLTQIANPAEREREAETLKRHNRYDKLKSIFRKDNPLSHEDAVWRHPENGHVLVNVGRAYFGGTKPMYIFEDRNEPIDVPGGQTRYKQYLFKEATNCVGHYKPEGALVTEAAANLQKIICGDYAISAFAAVADGKVLGSFQEKLDVRSREEGAVDLFSWQADPTASSAPDGDVKREILREHTLDWLLCNFDTKGENFLNRTDGHLSSFDKEASFARIKDAGSQHMSTEYRPHANDTLYNVMFSEYARGNLDLDLQSTENQLQRIEGMREDDYLALFDRMLTQKYGARGPKNRERTAVEATIWERKANLREEYRRFYTELLARRRESLRAQGGEDDTGRYFDAQGEFRFEHEAQQQR